MTLIVDSKSECNNKKFVCSLHLSELLSLPSGASVNCSLSEVLVSTFAVKKVHKTGFNNSNYY